MTDQDTAIRMAAFEHHLTSADFKPGFIFNGERIPLIANILGGDLGVQAPNVIALPLRRIEDGYLGFGQFRE